MLFDLAINITASLIFLAAGYLFGKYRERRTHQGKFIEEYDFYPFVTDANNLLTFDADRFNKAVSHFLKHTDETAAQQLILIGEQQNVSNVFPIEAKNNYLQLYKKYGGRGIMDDTAHYLENYKRIVNLIGDSFPDTGMEILLHNLTNPGKALYCLKNNVTGRNVDAPATSLVLDLKMRRMINQDKLNYELNIGARKFKCTTIPIYRERHGLVGAICINVDANYIDGVVRTDETIRNAFLDALCKTDMQLDENILSKAEYDKAMAGKRHFRDFSV
jgi:predicted transcriptional regulator YheO